MNYHFYLLALFAIFTTYARSFTPPSFLFHGTSVIIYPNTSSSWPVDNDVVASNFYCYSSGSGYLSFGWWLPATSDADGSHCTPRPSSYDWYEYTTSWDCSDRKCDAHVLNFSASNETVPYFEELYVLSTIDIGNGRLGKFGLSYFDKKEGGYAVGTKRILSDAAAASQERQDCKDALKTLMEIKDEKRPSSPFDMDDICQCSSGRKRQHFLGLTLM